ncbi:MAG: hypothetical protein E7400_07075 [Ruminococcaceae bacterium]|nr:hypothetical protein [Oscillospiraceae bacterium]
MKEAVPNYYRKFKCIAEKCRHNCCIGWEIDIDEVAMAQYQAMEGDIGERIRKNIEGEPPHFILGAGDRCPFLNDEGLCDIICALGEDALCDICTLHPRFRNFYSDFFETGLGLCCEEAARLILSEKEPFSVLMPADVTLSEEEELFFAKRQAIFDLLQDRTKSIGKRFSALAKAFGFDFCFSLGELCKLYLSLERLDENWTEVLRGLQDFSFDGRIFEEVEFQIPFEQLSVYFVFRHLTDAMWDGDYASRIYFALMSCYLIGAVWAKCGVFNLEKMAEVARQYSAEVEYSEENLDALMNG